MNKTPTLPTSCGSLPPEGAAAPADRLSRIRGPCLKGSCPSFARPPFVLRLSKDAPEGLQYLPLRSSRDGQYPVLL